ncbi:DEAD/DEAH box helicase [uncultured Thiohalocapsa sp.]|uniref:Lhr family helicase n=1 Tax=uncultured Thiohalocapsa sp. TaxID=768990 RepID=UPI0025D52A5B|nr:DEAD/DEAH box helicase [uncultured Thiohalocapsa sp.]
MDAFSSATQRWFSQNFAGPTDAQSAGWPVIAAGLNVLITAPTGSGKTLAAFLWSIDRLMGVEGPGAMGEGREGVGSDSSARGRDDERAAGTRVLYISPLKALVYDIERNLRAPLAGIASAAAALGERHQLPRVAIRTGDTSQRERAQQLKDPAEILVTTPESLYLLLGSRAAEHLASVHTVIVDEVHVLASSKRGAHLALSLERLTALVEAAGGVDPQRIGLSATVDPLAEAARWLGGERPVEIVDAAAPPKLDLTISVPVPDMEHPPQAPGLDAPGGPILGELYAREVARPPAEKGMWSAIYPALLDEILAHRSTIVFVNSRGLAERLCRRLNETYVERLTGRAGDDGDPDGGGALDPMLEGAEELADFDGMPAVAVDDHADAAADPAAEETIGLDIGELVRAHHGSVSHEQRAEIEDGLKAGTLKAIVATSSLEMGIDMGGVDQVLLVESPGSVARGLQRVGRAGHGVGEVSTGRIFPKFRGDLLECAVIAGRMLKGELEPFRMPSNALDVLAQQIAAHCVAGDRAVEEIQRLVNRAGPYRELSRAALESVLDMLSGRFPSSDFADLKPLLAWDRANDVLSPRKGAAMTTRLNAGTIPDRGNYAVHLGSEGPRIGELDEEMVFETRAGECILLGASTWRVEEITRDRVIVSPAPGEPGKLPFWRGDGPGRPVELGRAVGALCREVAQRDPEDAIDWIRQQAPLDDHAAANLAAYIHEQREATGRVPDERTLVIERFRDELGDWRICILTPFGARIHAPWAMALQWQLERREGFEIQVMYTDDGIVLRLADGDELPDLMALLPHPDEIEDRITEQLADTALFASLFRENAGRALLMPKRSAKGRRPLWAQRLKAQNLLAVVRRYPGFPVVLETYRQALSDQFDLAGLKDLLRAVQSRTVRVHEVETPSASPFARSLVFAYVAAYIYEQDAPIAERRAQALTLDRGLLAELLGQAELRELLDPRVLEEVEAELAHLTPERRARDADEVHDLLRRLGDLTDEEIIARSTAGAAEDDAGAAAGIGFDSDPDPDVDLDAGPSPGPGGELGGSTLVQTWLAELTRQRRAVQIPIAGERRWISAEDAGLYRDALGSVPPPGLPEAFIAPTEAPLEQLIRRYARTHGPFPTQQLARRLGLPAAQLTPVLKLLETRGELVHGEIRPFGHEPEWCDAEIMRRLRRRTLARARDEVAPVDGATLGRFLPDWHGIGAGDSRQARDSRERLLEALWQLEGLTVSWTQLDRVLLPARVTGYRPEDLDMLAATGQIVWVGRGAAGPKDGRIAVYRRENLGLGVASGEEPGSSGKGRGPGGEGRGQTEGAAVEVRGVRSADQEAAPQDAASPMAPDGTAAARSAEPGLGTADGSAVAGGPAAEAATAPSASEHLAADLRAALLDQLHRRGACFLMDLQRAAEPVIERAGSAGAAGREAFDSALWDLVWDGLVTNDTFAPLRSLAAGKGQSAGAGGRSGAQAGRRRGRAAMRGGLGRGAAAGMTGGLAGGRWSLVADLGAGEAITDTERVLLTARLLLERYGIVSREAVAAENLPGGFGPLYKVLKELEEGGQVRRGHFVEGLSGAQFALPGAVERLRAVREDEVPMDGYTEDDVRILPAADPANPFGALLAWPETAAGRDGHAAATGAASTEGACRGGDAAPTGRGGAKAARAPGNTAAKQSPKRSTGAWVILVAGRPVLYLAANGRQLLSFPTSLTDTGRELDLAAAALHRIPSGRRRLLIQHIDAHPALESPLREPLIAAGFEPDYDALAPARFRPTGTGRDPNAIACAGPRR